MSCEGKTETQCRADNTCSWAAMCMSSSGGDSGDPAKCNSITDHSSFCASNGANGLIDDADTTPCNADPCAQGDDAETCCKPSSDSATPPGGIGSGGSGQDSNSNTGSNTGSNTETTPCSPSDSVAISGNCKCASGSSTNECAAGKYCWTDNTCKSGVKSTGTSNTGDSGSSSSTGNSSPAPSPKCTTCFQPASRKQLIDRISSCKVKSQNTEKPDCTCSGERENDFWDGGSKK